jgi:hypothetical protein
MEFLAYLLTFVAGMVAGAVTYKWAKANFAWANKRF